MTPRRSLAARAIRWLAGLFPADVREAHGREIEQTLRSQHRDRRPGARPALAFWSGAVLDVLQTAPRQHAEVLAQDVRYSWRSLRRTPAFAVAAILTIALGTGATSAVFAVVNSVLLRPLPYREPSRVALVWATDPDGSRTWLSGPEVDDLAQRTTALEGVAGLSDRRLVLTGSGEPEELDVIASSPELFPVLGVSPVVGRAFTRSDAEEHAEPVAILSHAFWQRRFGGSPSIVGSTLRLDDTAHLVIGVLPASFGILPPSSVFPARVDAWVPLPRVSVTRPRDVRFLHAIARVRDGVAFEAARREVASAGAAMSRDFAREYRGRRWSFDLVPMQQDVLRGVRPPLVVLFATVTMVLLIACANVAALLLARGETRRREMAIRAALGASPSRVVRQLLTEGLVLALLGSALGLIVAFAAPRVTATAALASLPRFADVSLDWRVFAFAGGLAVSTALVFTVVPAVDVSRRGRQRAREVLGTASRTPGAVRIGRLLASAEVALSAIVLVVGLLLGRSFAQAFDADPGFRPDARITARVALPSKYSTGEEMVRFVESALDRIRQIGALESAAAVSQLPMSGAMLGSSFLLDSPGAVEPRRADADLRAIAGDYFETMGIGLVEGRTLTSRDLAGQPAVAVVDETMARRLWPGQSAIGKRIRWIRQPDVAIEVVGVVRAVRHRGLSQPPQDTVYRPLAQYPRSAMFFVARVAGNPAAAASGLSAAVHAVDRDQPVENLETMTSLVDRSLVQRGFGAALGGALAMLALALAAVGVYGMLAFAMAQRRRELGVRLALGSSPAGLVRLVMGDSVRVVSAGLIVGLPAAVAAAWWTQALVPGAAGSDATTLAVAGAVTALMALAASYLPARRASHTSPASALRADG